MNNAQSLSLGGQTCRQDNKIVVYLTQQQPVPDLVPYELHEYIFPDEWQLRLTAIREKAFRYHKPRLERIWYAISAISVILLPLMIYRLVLNALIAKGPDTESHFFVARAIALAVFLGLIIVLWAPLLIWKWIVARQVKTLLRGWAKTDNMNKQQKGFIPVWSVSQPSVFRSVCIVKVTIPPNARPTVFHPLTHPPPYINAPPDTGPMYYNPYAPGQPGVPYMTAGGNAPPYNANTKERMFENVNL